MILHLYSLKNRLSGIYERPVAEIYDHEEYIESLGQSLAVAQSDVLEWYKQYDVYSLGTMDSKTGNIVSSVEFVGTLEGVCTVYLAAKEKKDNVGEETRA